jgi:hypothetical protein
MRRISVNYDRFASVDRGISEYVPEVKISREPDVSRLLGKELMDFADSLRPINSILDVFCDPNKGKLAQYIEAVDPDRTYGIEESYTIRVKRSPKELAIKLSELGLKVEVEAVGIKGEDVCISSGTRVLGWDVLLAIAMRKEVKRII